MHISQFTFSYYSTECNLSTVQISLITMWVLKISNKHFNDRHFNDVSFNFFSKVRSVIDTIVGPVLYVYVHSMRQK